jgi:site-specific DNA-cytosine methylase
MKILELYAGSRSIGKAGEQLGHQVFSSDIEQFDGIDYVVDILEFDYNKVPFIPDMIWASPPCQGFSVASIGKNWNFDNTPKTDSARLGIKLALKTIEIINYYLKLNPNLIWFIENPRGKLRKMDFMQDFINHTVTYCQYGDTRMKPTDIWTNSKNWKPRPMCKNGDKCHVSAPRGSRTGTQGLKGDYERSKNPHELCLEVIKSCDII